MAHITFGELPESTLGTGIFLYCPKCGDRYSATRGDYWMRPAHETIACYGQAPSHRRTAMRLCREQRRVTPIQSGVTAILVAAALLVGMHGASHAQNADCGPNAGLQQAGTWQREQSDTPEGYEDIFYPAGRRPDPALRYANTQPVAGTLACDPFTTEATR